MVVNPSLTAVRGSAVRGGRDCVTSSSWLVLVKGQQFLVTIVEPASGNKTEMHVEVCYIHSRSIGLRFL